MNTLTPAQVQVLTDLAHGLSFKQIALRRGVGYQTVRRQFMAARGALGAETSMHAIAIFVHSFWTPLPQEGIDVEAKTIAAME